MVKVRYLGITNPKAAFDALRPYCQAIIEMETRCRPFGTAYLVLSAAKDALDTAACHFTRDPNFFASKLPQSVSGSNEPLP